MSRLLSASLPCYVKRGGPWEMLSTDVRSGSCWVCTWAISHIWSFHQAHPSHPVSWCLGQRQAGWGAPVATGRSRTAPAASLTMARRPCRPATLHCLAHRFGGITSIITWVRWWDLAAKSVLSSPFSLASDLRKASSLIAEEVLWADDWWAYYCSCSLPPFCSIIYSHKGRMNPVSPNNRNVTDCRGFAEINAYWNFNMAGSINSDSNFLCGRTCLISYLGMVLFHLDSF